MTFVHFASLVTANPNYMYPKSIVWRAKRFVTTMNCTGSILLLGTGLCSPDLAPRFVVTFLHIGRPDCDHVGDFAELLRYMLVEKNEPIPQEG